MKYNEETDMVEIFYNNKWNPWKNASLQWDGTLFLNGGFSSGQPITQYDLAYHNSSGSALVEIADNKLHIFTGTNGSTSNPMKLVACPNEKLNFNSIKFTSLTIEAYIYTWESIYKWEIGLCNSVPTSFDWDSDFTYVFAQKDTKADYSDNISVNIPLGNISGEKYLCFRASNSSGSRNTGIKISKLIFQ